MKDEFGFSPFEDFLSAIAAYNDAERDAVLLYSKIKLEGFAVPVNEPSYKETAKAHPSLQELENRRRNATDRALRYYANVVAFLNPQLPRLLQEIHGQPQIQTRTYVHPATEQTPSGDREGTQRSPDGQQGVHREILGGAGLDQPEVPEAM